MSVSVVKYANHFHSLALLQGLHIDTHGECINVDKVVLALYPPPHGLEGQDARNGLPKAPCVVRGLVADNFRREHPAEMGSRTAGQRKNSELGNATCIKKPKVACDTFSRSKAGRSSNW